VTADEAYDQVKTLRFGLEERGVAHVLATKVNDTVITTDGGDARVDQLIASLPRQAWKRLSCGAGAHGRPIYDWARVPIRICWENGFGHWVLARRSVSGPTEIAYYVCYGPVGTRLTDLVKVAGVRWQVETDHSWWGSMRIGLASWFSRLAGPAGPGVVAGRAGTAFAQAVEFGRVGGDDPVPAVGMVPGGDPAAVDPVVDAGGGHAQFGGQGGDGPLVAGKGGGGGRGRRGGGCRAGSAE
jgi:hypothetical protein